MSKKFEFVSYDRKDCNGKVTFNADGVLYASSLCFLEPESDGFMCLVKVCKESHVIWKNIPLSLSPEDKQNFLDMVTKNILPVISKCSICYEDSEDEDIKESDSTDDFRLKMLT